MKFIDFLTEGKLKPIPKLTLGKPKKGKTEIEGTEYPLITYPLPKGYQLISGHSPEAEKIAKKLLGVKIERYGNMVYGGAEEADWGKLIEMHTSIQRASYLSGYTGREAVTAVSTTEVGLSSADVLKFVQACVKPQDVKVISAPHDDDGSNAQIIRDARRGRI